ncbi:MAG: hypothetical protein ACYC96_06375 [Fimbriimonadaceae bacterium]
MTFDEWMERLDRSCQLDFGLNLAALPNLAFRDGYDSGLSPEDFMAENLPDPELTGQLVSG